MNDDRQLQKFVQAELGWEPSVTAAHIGVAAKDGVVTLTGHVGSYAEKHAAEAAASRVKGVKAVAEEIEVRLPYETKRTDEEIAASAIDRLAWDVFVPKDAVKVRVEKGWITLTGQVDWNFQKDAANQDLRRLFGVLGVSDQITIKPRVDVVDVTHDIEHALHRTWQFDRDKISVSATGGRVRLTGTVYSPHDKQVAAWTAWAAPGVTNVDNAIASPERAPQRRLAGLLGSEPRYADRSARNVIGRACPSAVPVNGNPKSRSPAMHGDSQLQKSVLAELSWEPSVTAAHIGATANEGVVSLSGHVGSFGEKHAIEVATRRVKGVKAVVEGIGVRLAFGHERDDDEIAKAALDRLAWHALAARPISCCTRPGRPRFARRLNTPEDVGWQVVGWQVVPARGSVLSP